MFLYRLILTLLPPALVLRLWRRDTPADRQQRRAMTLGVSRGAIWVHAASNGELASARAVIEDLAQRGAVLVTCNTVTGRALVESWGQPQVQALLAPLDHSRIVNRFLTRHAPKALIVIENELWPNRLLAMAARGAPVIVMSARVSASSARNWQRSGGLARKLLSTLALVSAQDSQSQERLVALGLPLDRLGPILNLKTTLPPAAPNPPDLQRLQAIWPRETTVLAASTHDGEDAIILEAFEQARQTAPDLRLILAPRHPARRDALVRLLDQRGLRFVARSVAPCPAGDSLVYLADTMGEMPLWYALSGSVFVGGSLVDKGGHTPFEPAAFGCALIHGPHLDNFRPAYDRLLEAQASTQVTDAASLAQAMLQPAPNAHQAQELLRDTGAADTLADLMAQIDTLIPEK